MSDFNAYAQSQSPASVKTQLAAQLPGQPELLTFLDAKIDELVTSPPAVLSVSASGSLGSTGGYANVSIVRHPLVG